MLFFGAFLLEKGENVSDLARVTTSVMFSLSSKLTSLLFSPQTIVLFFFFVMLSQLFCTNFLFCLALLYVDMVASVLFPLFPCPIPRFTLFLLVFKWLRAHNLWSRIVKVPFYYYYYGEEKAECAIVTCQQFVKQINILKSFSFLSFTSSLHMCVVVG